jgi:hypothetical protein
MSKVLEEGKKVFIRTVTYHMVGKIEAIKDGMIELSDASWIADSGRFSNAIKNGDLNEVEPVGDACVSLGALVDAFPWTHDLPTNQK